MGRSCWQVSLEGSLVKNPFLRALVAVVAGFVLMMIASAVLSALGGVGLVEILLFWVLGALAVWFVIRPRTSSSGG
jgi:hypothetical protein